MEGGHTLLVPDPVKRGDVTETDQRLGVCLEGVDVDASQQPMAAAPTAQSHDRPDLGIADRVVEVGQTVLVLAGEIAESCVYMRAQA